MYKAFFKMETVEHFAKIALVVASLQNDRARRDRMMRPPAAAC